MEFPIKQNPFQLHKLRILVSSKNKYETGTDLASYLRMSLLVELGEIYFHEEGKSKKFI